MRRWHNTEHQWHNSRMTSPVTNVSTHTGREACVRIMTFQKMPPWHDGTARCLPLCTVCTNISSVPSNTCWGGFFLKFACWPMLIIPPVPTKEISSLCFFCLDEGGRYRNPVLLQTWASWILIISCLLMLFQLQYIKTQKIVLIPKQLAGARGKQQV